MNVLGPFSSSLLVNELRRLFPLKKGYLKKEKKISFPEGLTFRIPQGVIKSVNHEFVPSHK